MTTKLDNNKIEFHAWVVTNKNKMQEANFNILNAEQDDQARELGILIAKTKGWSVEPTGDSVTSKLDLFVFTKEELEAFVAHKLEESA